MDREDVLQTMQRTARGSHGSWNCPLVHTDHGQQQCCKNEDNDSNEVSGDVTTPTLLLEANEGLLYHNNSQKDDLGFRDKVSSTTTGSSEGENLRVNSVALQHVRRDGKDNYLVDVEPTSNATEGHSSSSLWDTPLVHVHMSKVEEEDNSFSAERCSSSCGDHPPSRLLLMSPQCMIGCSIADRRYPPHNEREELGEYLGIKEANKGFIILEKLGWVKGNGLGKQEQGIISPVSCSMKRGKESWGLGLVQCDPSDQGRGDGNGADDGTFTTTWVTAAADPPSKEEEVNLNPTKENVVIISLEENKLKLQGRLEHLRSNLGDMKKCLGLSDLPICPSWANRQSCTEGLCCPFRHFHDDVSMAVARKKIQRAMEKTSSSLDGYGDWNKPLNSNRET